MLIGHGSYDGAEYKFNIPGPDLTGAELASLLDHIPAQRQLVVNMTSSQRRLHRVPAQAQSHRHLRHQDRSRKERHRLRALLGRSPARSGGRYGQERIRLARSKRSATRSARPPNFSTRKSASPPNIPCWRTPEKARARSTPTAENGQGKLAAAFPLVRLGANAAAARDPNKKPLLDKKEQLEQAIDKLKYEKAAMPAEEYKKPAHAAPPGTRQNAGGPRQTVTESQ